MGGESRWLKIGDVLEKVIDNRGKTPPNQESETPYELIEVNALRSDSKRPVYDEIRKFVSKETFESWFRSGHPKKGDVLFSTVGSIAEVAVSEGRGCIAQNVIALRPKHDLLDGDFLYYTFRNPIVKNQLLSLDISSVQPSIKVPHLLDIELLWPPILEQQKIVSVLSCIDDKIELNRQINTTLESMAQALFKSWFVDFDPVIDNALAAGNEIPPELQARAEKRQALLTQAASQPDAPLQPLPADLRALFPASFVLNEELGWVPEGWGVVQLRSLTTKIGSGSTPRGGQQVYRESGVSLIRSQNVYDSMFTWDGLAHIDDEAADQLKSVSVNAGDVLLNITGASILRTCIVDPDVLPARVNQHVAIVRPIDGIPSKFIHLHLLHDKTKNHLMGQNAGASREAVTKGHIEAVPTLKPNIQVLERFELLTSTICKSVDSRFSNIRILTSIRDALLPKLLSGQIQLPEAEQQLAEAL